LASDRVQAAETTGRLFFRSNPAPQILSPNLTGCRFPGGRVTTPPEAAVDPLMWWEDKQIAVEMSGRVVRAWVLRARSHPGPPRADGRVGYLRIVLLMNPSAELEQYPAEMTIPVHAAAPHGRPLGVLGVWPDDDLSDARPTRSAPVSPTGKVGSGRRTRSGTA
jgi:hypothetical protein